MELHWALLTFLFLLLQFSSSWCLHSKFADADQINQIDTNPSNTMILSASKAKSVVILNKTNYLKLGQYLNNTQVALTAKWSKNGQYIAVGYNNQHFVHIIDGAPPFAYVTSFNTNHQTINQVDWNSGNTKLLTCGKNQGFKVWNIGTWTQIGASSVNVGQEVVSCKFDSSDRVAVGLVQGRIKIYSTSGNLIANDDTGQTVNCIDWSPDSLRVISGNKDGQGSVYTISSTNFVTPVNEGNSNQMFACAYSPDSSYYAFGGAKRILSIINGSANTLSAQTNDSLATITALNFSPDNNFLYVGDSFGVVYVYAKNCTTLTKCTAYQFYDSATSICVNCTSMIGCSRCSDLTACLQCTSNYYLVGTTCSTCISNIGDCITCNSSTQCTNCVTGFYLTTTFTCMKCGQTLTGCLQCVNSSVCTSCQNNFYLHSTNFDCVKCMNAINYCLICRNSSYCDECLMGFYQSSGSCVNCGTNCLICDSNTYCQQCVKGYYPSGSGSTCTSCPFGCIKCNQTGYCLDCFTNMYPNGGICSFCSGECLSCNSSNYCLSCRLGYFYDGAGGCTKCSSGCLHCQSATHCEDCSIGYYLLSNTSCQNCKITYNNQCTHCDGTHCKDCLVGYYLNSTYDCELCSKIIFACQNCNSTKCFTCFPGYYLFSNTQCKACPQGCTTCLYNNSIKCSSCSTGYFYLSATKVCTRCSLNCETCSSSATCLGCVPHFFLDSGNCQECTINITHCLSCKNSSYCENCQEGYYLNPTFTSCSACLSPCTSCLSSTVCQTCQLGYFLNTSDTICYKCPTNCSQCVNNISCQACDLGFYYNNGGNICQSCQLLTGKNCLTCTSTQCLQCPLGYYLSSVSPKSCSFCSNSMYRCLQCKSATNCIKCEYGYTLTAVPNSCQPCHISLPGCLQCLDLTTCTICQPSFYLTATNTCSQCIDGCSMCTNSTDCLSCQIGFLLNVGTVPYSCDFCQLLIGGCQICSAANVCQNCLEGFYLVSPTQCKLCRKSMYGCLLCNASNICNNCQDGYYLHTNNKCNKCSTMVGCQFCNSSTVCIDCESSFYLDSNRCIPCISDIGGCLYCLNATHCRTCLQGYYLDTTNPIFDQKCILCTSQLQACKRCDDINTCLQCQSGYYLNSVTHKCIQCAQKGCEICEENSPTVCITCNRGYYYDTGVCHNCFISIYGCIDCVNSHTCAECDVGFFTEVDASLNVICSLCSESMQACSRCSTSTVCLQCKSLYFVNSSNLCERCSIPLEGCSYCVNSSVCLNCAAGYYLDSSTNVCALCSTLDGCLLCSNEYACQYCKDNYYLNSSKVCIACSIIKGCYSCISDTVCSSCVGGYNLTNKLQCEVILLQSNWENQNMKMKTSYVNEETLKHRLYVSGTEYVKIQQQWQNEVVIRLVDNHKDAITLNIKSVEWGKNGKYLQFLTNNPLNFTQNNMPIKRLLLVGSLVPLSYSINLQITKKAMSEILPNYNKGRALSFQYSLSLPQLYASYILSGTVHKYYIFGTVTTCLLFFGFLISVLLFPKISNKGNIIPHILAMKFSALSLYPTYSEYINFSWGFMTADFPWANKEIGQIFGSYTAILPLPHQIFYTTLNIGCTYLISIFVFLVLVVIFRIILGLIFRDTERLNSVNQFLYFFFILGLIMATCFSIQGAIQNSLDSFSWENMLYIIGILMYGLICIYTIYHAVFYQKGFIKVRLLIKCTTLTYMHTNPIYYVSSITGFDIVTCIIQYFMVSDRSIFSKIRIGTQITANLCLLSLIILPLYQLTLLMVGFTVIIITIFEIILNIIQIYYLKTWQMKQREYPINKKTTQANINFQQSQVNIWDLYYEEKKERSEASLAEMQSANSSSKINAVPKKTKIRPQIINQDDLKDQLENKSTIKVDEFYAQDIINN